MHIEPRNGASIDRVYIHKNEGPEQEGGAVGLGRYLDTIDGGYHRIVDDKVTVIKANDDEVVWGEGGDNEHALAICDVGWSSETAAQYLTDPFTIAEFERTAQEVAAWCKAHDVPPVHVSPGAPGAAPTERGIAEHADDHDPASQGHTDPGVGYPIDILVTRVKQILAPVDWAALEALQDFREALPLHEGDQGWAVTALKQFLNQLGVGPGNDEPIYGPTLVNFVKLFKVAHNVGNDDGTTFGTTACDVLFKLL